MRPDGMVNKIVEALVRIRDYFNESFKEPEEILTLEYIGELVEKFEWIDPIFLPQSHVYTDFKYNEGYDEKEYIRFTLKKEELYKLEKVKVPVIVDDSFTHLLGQTWYMVDLEEHRKVYGDEDRLEFFIDSEVKPMLNLIRLDNSHRYDYALIRLEYMAMTFYNIVQDANRLNVDIPDSIKGRVFEFLKIFIRITNSVKEKADEWDRLLMKSEEDSLVQLIDSELEPLKESFKEKEEIL